MFFCLAPLLKAFGLFQQPLLPSFFDGSLRIDHDHDAELQTLFASITVPPTFARYNPPPAMESSAFARCPDKGNMIQRNMLLMSRLFIQHARELNLGQAFQHRQQIAIVDIGCGAAPTLPGILAYFNKLGIKVNYLGVDIDGGMITECQSSYGNLPNVSFVRQNIQELIKDKTHQHRFDLILCQHPDLENPHVRPVFLQFFLHHKNLLADGGICYSTLYYASEKSVFEQEVISQIGGKLHEFQSPALLQNRFSGENYFPERFIFMSERHERILDYDSNVHKKTR